MSFLIAKKGLWKKKKKQSWIQILDTALMSEKYEIKTKMLQEHWLQLKMMFLLDYNLKFSGRGLTFGGEGIKSWWGESTGGIFPGGGE